VTDQLMKFMLFIEKIYTTTLAKICITENARYDITASNAKVLRQKRRKSFLEKTLHVVMYLSEYE
jgi:hypothetical protein